MDAAKARGGSSAGPGARAADRKAAPDAQIGERLRAERERLGLSLRKLAARLELSPSALSQIETGRSRPSVKTLYALVSELGISFDSLFASEVRATDGPGDAVSHGEPGGITVRSIGNDPEQIVQRAGTRKTIELESGVLWERLNPPGDRDVEFLEVTYAVGGASSSGGTYVRHAGREYGLVLSGRLQVTVGFDEFELRPGDSVCFESSTPHRLATVGLKPVKAVWFVIGRAGSDARAGWDAN
jgi:transcriptional regulator with XRE-family HTH domain